MNLPTKRTFIYRNGEVRLTPYPFKVTENTVLGQGTRQQAIIVPLHSSREDPLELHKEIENPQSHIENQKGAGEPPISEDSDTPTAAEETTVNLSDSIKTSYVDKTCPIKSDDDKKVEVSSASNVKNQESESLDETVNNTKRPSKLREPIEPKKLKFWMQ